MTSKNFILATAGHVDHGKSALIKALTGTDPDRLPEEKARGITIELGFAHLELPSPNEADTVFSIGVIDVPGHEDFVKNMVAGVGAIDLALLVVAADDGWMPQTEEHLQILSYLGVSKIVVALTKVDLVASTEPVIEMVRTQLHDTPFADAPIVPTSLPQSSGLGELRRQLSLAFVELEPSRDIGKSRLFVDRAFTLRGTGTIVTGTLTGGMFRRGENIVVQPSGLSARIRSIQNHSREVAEIAPGSRVALNIPEFPVARRSNEEGVRRGEIIARVDLGMPHAVFDVLLTRSARLPSHAPPLRHGTRVRVHHGSGNLAARVLLQKNATLGPGQSGLAELRFASPVFAFVGDRLVVRDTSEQQTLAGGVILDAEASAKKFRSSPQREFLQRCAQFPLAADRFLEAHLQRDCVVRRRICLVKSHFCTEEIATAWQRLGESGVAVLLGGFAVEAKWWNAVVTDAANAIDAEHGARPERAGLELARLRSAVSKEAVALFDPLVIALQARGFVRSGDIIGRETHRPALPSHLRKAGELLRQTLDASAFDPPSRKEIAGNISAQQALRFLFETGEAIELSPDAVLSAQAFEKMRDTIVVHLRERGAATVSELRQALGSSRRVMVPFLERLDRDGVTRRNGDRRILAR